MYSKLIFIACISLVAIIVTACAAPSSCTVMARALLEREHGNRFGKGAIVSEPKTVLEIEKKKLKEMTSCPNCPQVPFGYENETWLAFKSQLKPGDCIIFFSSDRNSWNQLMGIEGYALIRNNELVTEIIGRLN